MDIVSDFIDKSLGYFINPSKRIYVLYLASALLLAYYVFVKTKPQKSFLRYIFNKQVWLGRSAWIDYKLFLFNGVVKLFLLSPYVYLGFHLSFYVSEWFISHYDYMQNPLKPTTAVVLYTFVLTIITDFFVFVVHYSMHKIPFLWRFHKIHHSATSMNPITQYRIHPIELIINNIVGILIFGIVTGIFTYFASGYVSKWTFLGANVFSFVFFMMGANLRHSHVRFRYLNVLEYLFISPLQHQIHHSRNPKHWNKNMGSRLAIWDWMFGTLVRSKEVQKLTFGLGQGQDKDYRNFIKVIINPFIKQKRLK